MVKGHKSVLQKIGTAAVLLFLVACASTKKESRIVADFNPDWNFKLGDYPTAIQADFNANDWRALDLPHDWSIEGTFDKDSKTKQAQGFLPAGKGWYRKTFTLPENLANKSISVEFDGVFKNSEVFINGHSLGMRPNGYISFAYELTPYLHFGTQKNIIAVKVDNDAQPNSRWYTGSGIYRNVRLVASEKLHVAQWGTYVTTRGITKEKAIVDIDVDVKNGLGINKLFKLVSTILDKNNVEVAKAISDGNIPANSILQVKQNTKIENPILWNTENPYLYKIVTKVYDGSTVVDTYETPLGVRYFNFDAEKGFSLNGKPTKILGVCLHHDNGALGAVENIHAIRRKLTLLKEMGTNAIRMSHNPHSLEMMKLCDEMGFIVQDEFTDVWKKKKVTNDYHKDWDAWHKQDLEDFIKRDRNHPSVMMWSIGNEIREQFDSTGVRITRELAQIVKSLDKTRPVTSALTENEPQKNFIYQSGALDLLGFNYKHADYATFPERFKGQKIVASESVSAYATRGHYDMPTDEIRFWPKKYGETFDGNSDLTVTAYDNIASYWGTTHEENWKAAKKYDFIAGTFVWTGFDYIGEPDPYPYPARSSYFGIVDLAGFPKDVYYMYQSEWSDKNVLHLLPHWNWKVGQLIDVWAYYNNADEVELFLNGKSLGSKAKQGDELHIAWKVPFEAGTLKAVSRKAGKIVKETEIHTAGEAAKINLQADKTAIKNDGYHLAYVTVTLQDKDGNALPKADNLINFKVSGGAKIVGVDNGYQASLEPFKANYRKLYNGKCLVILQSNKKAENITLEATTAGNISLGTVNIKVE
ncbi:beta-galactosidase [Flavobacterium glycines]|uniref:Beta-galactosidase n=1 Tax=Flavobacterium glycines TaxID=551990 RepID=A0A1B9DP90_9FLAO|nr:sugar-binding domain-containing protein [Flavobacterium glycines]OCB71507.1 glycoside hydrolase [Flavobacterium glycines]GEL10535.1 beta-galactosidase [Flavobacterium glycines]SDI64172.1 beta-galactosidase [Flavobacterium glycines]